MNALRKIDFSQRSPYQGSRPLNTHVIAAALLTYESQVFSTAKRFTARTAGRGKDLLSEDLATVPTEELEAYRAALLDTSTSLESLHITKDRTSIANMSFGVIGTLIGIGASVYGLSIGASLSMSILVPGLVLAGCALLISSSHVSPLTRRIWFADLLELVISRRTGKGRGALSRVRGPRFAKQNATPFAA
jgi:hypothetical protein